MAKPAGRKRIMLGPRMITLLVSIIVLVALGYILMQSATAIHDIQVIGNSYCTREEVIAASGVQLGQSAMSINAGQVRDRINQNRYLEFVSLSRNMFPGSVVITVREHAPRAKYTWMGMLIILGENGVVLERTSQIDSSVFVPEIIGMDVESAQVGSMAAYRVAGQGDAITDILDALDLQGVTGEIAEINVATPDNLQLLTESGLQVILGDGDRLPEKIALMRDTLPYVQQLHPGRGGILNVSSGETADFRKPPQ
ncbi:FtsQ-type POTRA domain-containing protein [Eubacteriales bacterium OttesenSCG-928-A19]|nr:FtsQ-type POTRA domain-containing protein [Eubacteriales bacterium OttesenSCG-928-A19]